MLFKVTFEKHWTETGESEVSADCRDEAIEIARQMLSDDSTEIEWHSESMDPGDQSITHVTRID